MLIIFLYLGSMFSFESGICAATSKSLCQTVFNFPIFRIPLSLVIWAAYQNPPSSKTFLAICKQVNELVSFPLTEVSNPIAPKYRFSCETVLFSGYKQTIWIFSADIISKPGKTVIPLFSSSSLKDSDESTLP